MFILKTKTSILLTTNKKDENKQFLDSKQEKYK